MKKLFQTIYSINAISELKNIKISKSLFLLIIYSLFLNFGLAFSIIQMDTFDPTIISKEIYQGLSRDHVNQLPNCQVINSKLICNSSDVFTQEFNNFNLVINPQNDDSLVQHKTNILFLKDKISIVNDTSTYDLNYQQFKNVDFNSYKKTESKYVIDDLSNRLFLSIKPLILLPLLLTIYLIVVSLNIIFILGLAGLGTLLNIGNKHPLSYKQLLNIVILSSLTPTLISFFVSIIISPIFGVVIYNFSLALFFLYVYKNVIKGNFI
ncbi:DUF1189 family protein [Mycoplasmatota bacterium]|nr:DUF1189 family protein [Mycoplasmatota bacterium]